MPACLQELEQGVDHECVVVEIGRKAGAAVLVACIQAAIEEQLLVYELRSGCRCINEVFSFERPPCNRKSANGQCIP